MLIDIALTNEARTKIADLLRQSPGKRAGRYMSKIAKVERPVMVNAEQVERAVLEALGVTPGTKGSLPPEMQATVEGIAQGLAPMTRFWLLGQAPPGTNVVAVLRDGKAEYYEIADPILMRSLTAFNRPAQHGLIRVAGLFRRLGQMAITLTPDFMAANILRDTLMGFAISRHGFTPFLDSAKGLMSRLTTDPDYKDYIANGGGISSYLLDEASYRANLESFYRRKGIDPRTVLGLGRRGWQGIERIADAFEMSTRLGAFKKARRAGLDARAAAYQGREVSVDFGMRGDSRTIGALYDTIIFLKAAVNSVDRLYRGVAHDPQRGSIAYKTALIGVLSMGLYALNRDNPLYEELEDWDRDGHWHFFVPKPAWWEAESEAATVEEAREQYHHFRYPKIWEIGAVASISERALEAIVDPQSHDTRRKIFDIVGHLMGWEYIPAFATPLYELAINENRFTNTPIVGLGEKGLEPWAQSKPYTARIARGAGETTRNLPTWAQISPAKFEHLLRGYMHTWALYGMTLSDAVFFDDKPDLRLDQMPVVRRFYRQQPARNTRHVTAFYEMMEAATRTRRTMFEMARRNRPEELQRLIERRETRIWGVLSRGNKRFQAYRRMTEAVLEARSVEELRKFAERMSRSLKRPKLLTDARQVWRDKGALKLLLRDALVDERNRTAAKAVSLARKAMREQP